MSVAGRGKLIVFSGPSGAGKTTVLRQVYRRAPVPLTVSVSATTRPPRPGEVDGVDYHFLSTEEFDARRQRGCFLECFQVFGNGYWYGTPQKEVSSGLAAGKWVVLEIDVQGALAVTKQYADAITVFIRPSSVAELQRRLRQRGTESEQSLQQRLARAEGELNLAGRYQYQVINDDVDEAVEKICHILTELWESSGND